MARQPTLLYSDVNGVRLALWEWPGDDPPMVFVHATGFHGRCWGQVVAQFPDQRCYAVEMRGHGRSSKPAPPYDWRWFGKDLIEVLAVCDARNAIGIGHSMGGHATALAAALAPTAFAQIVLLDPVIMPREAYIGPHPVPHFAARRRNHWHSPEEMYERFAPRAPFNRWDARVLRDYCTYGLLPAPHGKGYVLACPPAIEASIYQHSTDANIYDELARVQVPVTVVRLGEHMPIDRWDMDASPTAPDLAVAFAQSRDVHILKHTHFMPMESPERTAQVIREAVMWGQAQ